jgi:predicted DNA-binding protein (MmcQ/YjbR family)
MSIQSIHMHLLSKPGAVEERPFAPETPVFKVMGKMFAYTSPQSVPPSVTIKLEPLHGQLVRSMYDAVLPGYHMNKEHWNTIQLDGSLPLDLVKEWIDESYTLVVSKLPLAAKHQLARQRE